jgi:hypothetical protein
VSFWKRFVGACFLFLSTQLTATEYLPWVGPTLEFEWRDHLRYQHYRFKKRTSDDLFLNISLSNAYQDLGVELEITAANTNRQPGHLDQLKITGRKVLLDDILEDPVSLTAGCSLIQAFRSSLCDRSSFHHGYNEAELFVSTGKELTFSENWESRLWGIAGLGVAIDRGSPWIHLEGAYEQRWHEKHECRIGLYSLYGLGHQKLRLHHFHGYGPVKHRSVDIQLRYTYLIDFFGNASIEFSQRLYAHHFPAYARSVTLQLMYSFGLGLEW